jgi:hypothetical protein
MGRDIQGMHTGLNVHHHINLYRERKVLCRNSTRDSWLQRMILVGNQRRGPTGEDRLLGAEIYVIDDA